MFDRFTDSARQSMQVANREANHNGHQYIGNLHIFIAILDTDPAILDISGIDLIQLRNTANEIVSTTPSSGIKQTFEHALALNKKYKTDAVDTPRLLLGMLTEPDESVRLLLDRANLDIEQLRIHLLQQLKNR